MKTDHENTGLEERRAKKIVMEDKSGSTWKRERSGKREGGRLGQINSQRYRKVENDGENGEKNPL